MEEPTYITFNVQTFFSHSAIVCLSTVQPAVGGSARPSPSAAAPEPLPSPAPGMKSRESHTLLQEDTQGKVNTEHRATTLLIVPLFN